MTVEHAVLKGPPAYTAEERRAWDLFVAGWLARGVATVEGAAEVGDELLSERRKRFGSAGGAP